MTRPQAVAVSAALLAVTVVTAGLALLGVQGPVRVIVTLVFLLAAPGWCVVAFFRPAGSSLTVALVVAGSVAIDLLAGELMLLTSWQPVLASACALGVCAAVLVVHLARRPAEGAA